MVSFLLVGLMGLGVACQQQMPDTRAADEAAIKARESEWSRLTAGKDAAAYASYFAQDGAAGPPNQPLLSGRQAIEEWAAGVVANPGFAVNWGSSAVEVARSGELGYTVGTYELTLNDPKGNPVTTKGKYIAVWKKQADGTWEVVTNLWNPDQ